MSNISSSSSTNNARKPESVQAVYASVNENYPFWCSTFEHDLRNYYQPLDTPLELYIGGAAHEDTGCFHTTFNLNPNPVRRNPTHDTPRSSSSSSSPCYLDYHPHCSTQYNPHHLNNLHIGHQVWARYASVPFSRRLVDRVNLQAEALAEESDALHAQEVPEPEPEPEPEYEQVGRKRRRMLGPGHAAARTAAESARAGVGGTHTGVPTGMYVANETVMVRHTGLEVPLDRVYDVPCTTPKAAIALQRVDGHVQFQMGR